MHRRIDYRLASVPIIFALSVVLVWVGIGTFRLYVADRGLEPFVRNHPEYFHEYPNSQLTAFFQNRRLNYWRSVGPLLKQPLRETFTLFYGRDSAQCHYDSRRMIWSLKIF